jgi:hypothetical protein
MRVMRFGIMVLIGLAAGTCIARANEPERQAPLPSRSIRLVVPAPDAVSAAERLASIERWTREYTAWKQWFELWRNRREPGWFGTRQRRERPDPPASLAGACPVPADETGILADACRLFAEWRSQDAGTAIATQQVAATRTQNEAPRRTVWWQHVHLDALWPMTQGSSGMFGVVGLHTTIKVTGRVQVFVAPGAILMRVPDASGSQQWKPATDWGFSYRMFDFTMPGMRRQSTLHVNLAKVWLLGSTENLAGVNSEMYLAGFSLTFRKNARSGTP